MSCKEKAPPRRALVGLKILLLDDGGRVLAAAAAMNMNDDACMEILLRLPAKSVIRFKSVCKRWLSLISTHHFRRLHTLRRPKTPPSLILARSFYPGTKFLYFNPIIDTHENSTKTTPFYINLLYYPKILTSSNGLLLMSCRCEEYKDEYFYVYNPTTNQSRKLSLPNNYKGRVVQLHLVFDPSVSIHYKIVCIRSGSGLNFLTYQKEVFDSESGNWNICNESITITGPSDGWTTLSNAFSDFQFIAELNFGSPLHCSNMIYGIINRYDLSLYCFDISTNALWFLPLPTLANHQLSPIPSLASQLLPFPTRANHQGTSNICSQMLQASDRCLYFVYFHSQDESAVLWELQLQRDDPCRSLWLLKYHRRLRCCPFVEGRRYSLLRFDTETSTLLIHVPPGKIVAYSFLDESYTELVDLKHPFYCSSAENVHQFAETLALL